MRQPGNWGDRTLGTGKLTYSPIQTLKLLATLNRSRNQNSYPNGWGGEGHYFQTGIFNKGEIGWDSRPWAEGETTLYVPQAYARKLRTSNVFVGADWDIFRSAERSASMQFRYSYVKTVEIHNGSIRNNWERDDFLGWSWHDVPFEIERYPNREGPPSLNCWPDGATGWKMGVPYTTPLHQGDYTAYYLNYNYLKERQHNVKTDFDLQWNRCNRGKLGFQLTDFSNLSFRTDYRTTQRDPMNEFRYKPQLFGLYMQNRTDLQDFVFDYGLRFDSFNPKANWGITRTDPWGEDVKSVVHSTFSPRFDVGFPVTDKSQLRFSYGVFTQLPSFDFMFDRGGNPGGLEYCRTDAFEAGLSYLLSEDMVLDYVAYYRDVDGNVAVKEFFEDKWLWYNERRSRTWRSGPTNRDNGNIKGFDLTLRRAVHQQLLLQPDVHPAVLPDHRQRLQQPEPQSQPRGQHRSLHRRPLCPAG